ncbi:hypothetical protein ACI65C_009749 [Semiaphis heraclei]
MHLFNRRGTHHEKENNTLVCDDVTHLNSADDVIVYIADIQRNGKLTLEVCLLGRWKNNSRPCDCVVQLTGGLLSTECLPPGVFTTFLTDVPSGVWAGPVSGRDVYTTTSRRDAVGDKKNCNRRPVRTYMVA